MIAWRWNPLEVAWTAFAAVCIVPAAVVWLRRRWHELLLAWLGRAGRPRRLLGAAFWFSVAILLLTLGLTDMAVGIIAGTQPERVVDVAGQDIVIGVISAGLFLTQEFATAVVLYLGLWLDWRLRTWRPLP